MDRFTALILCHPAEINAGMFAPCDQARTNEMHAVTTDGGDRGCPAPVRNMSG